MFGCRNNFSCIIAWIISITLGIILGIVSFGTLIPEITTALLISFGIAILGVIVTIVLGLVPYTKECLCEKGKCLAVSSIGLVLFTIIALSITIVTESVGISILLGIITAFLIATILSIFNTLICLVDKSCKKCRDMRID